MNFSVPCYSKQTLPCVRRERERERHHFTTFSISRLLNDWWPGFTSVLETATNSPDTIIISRLMCYENVCYVNLFSNRPSWNCIFFASSTCILPALLVTFPHVRTATGPAGIIDVWMVHCVCSFHLLLWPCSSFWRTPAFCQHLARRESYPLSWNCQKSAAWIASAASSWILVLFMGCQIIDRPKRTVRVYSAVRFYKELLSELAAMFW